MPFLESVTGPAPCVGFSLGGTIVLWAAASRPDLIPHAVVAGTSTVVGRAAAAFFRERIELVSINFAAFPEALRSDTEKQIVSAKGNLGDVTDELRVDPVGNGDGYVNAARAMLGLHQEPLTPRLGEIRCHVDVVGGDADVFCPRKAADIMVEALPHATYHEIANCGHWMPVDQPEAYAHTLSAILRRRAA